MSKETEHIELKNEEVQEILGSIPNWVVRWGTSVIFLALVGIFVVAGIVKFPQTINTSVEITSNKPPVAVVAQSSGNLEKFLVEEGDEVIQGEILAVIQNTMNEEELAFVQELLDTFLLNPTSVSQNTFPNAPQLGGLQDVYATFLTSFKDYDLYASQNVNNASIGYINQQISRINNINIGLQSQIKDCQSAMNVFYTNYLTDQDLLEKGIISNRQAQDSETNYYNKRESCEELAKDFNNNEIRIQQLNLQIFGLSSGDKESDMLKYTQLRENANLLRSEIKLWQEQFLIKAPIGGIVSLNEVWSNSQYISSQDELLSIIQPGGEIKARALVSNSDVGKILPGQTVNIKFPAYNFMQFGMVKGEIEYISAVPRDQFYQVEITLSDGLKTTYQKNLKFQQGMVGNAEVITEKRTVLERLFDKFKYLFSKK